MSRKSWWFVSGGAAAIAATAAMAPVVWAAADTKVPAVATSSVSSANDAPVRKAAARVSWLKVQILEEKDGQKDTKVSVTLPLAVLALLGDDASVDLSELGVKGLKDHQKSVRIMDVLHTLEPGTVLVEVREAKEHVRVWVE